MFITIYIHSIICLRVNPVTFLFLSLFFFLPCTFTPLFQNVASDTGSHKGAFPERKTVDASAV